jgi:hypothetical protein
MKIKTNEFETMSVSNHKKQKAKLHATYILLALAISSLLAFAYAYNVTYTAVYDMEMKAISKVQKMHIVNTAKASVEAPKTEVTAESNFEEWMYREWEKAGFKRKDVACLISRESGGREDASYVNTDHSVDRGIFMINSKYHKNVASKCAYDKVCATKAAIKIAKARGNLSAWYGFINFCQ